MIKQTVFILVMAMAVNFIGCSDEPYRIEDSTCGKFLASHPEIVKNYQHISCFDSTTVVYQLKRITNVAFLAEIQDKHLKIKQLIEYPTFERKIIFRDVDTLKSSALKKFNELAEQKISMDSSYDNHSLKRIVMEIEGLEEDEFDKKIKSDDTLNHLLDFLWITDLLSADFSIVRKNDSTFYLAECNYGPPNRIILFSRNGERIKDLFRYQPVTNCHEQPLIFSMKPQGTDSTFFMEFSYVREEIKDSVYQGFVSYDLKTDSLSYGSNDSLTLFYAERYKPNGDTIQMWPKIMDDFNDNSKRRKCIGHVIY